MKKLLWACVLALPVLALPTEAKAFVIGNYEVDTGARVWCNVKQFNISTPTAGPWYMYYPYEAYFRVPAPGVSPYFPPPMMLPPGFGPPPPMPPAQAYQAPMPAAPPGYRPPMPAAPPGYRPPMPAGPQGYYPPMGAPAQAYQPQYRPPVPAGIPHPDVFSYYGR